MDRLTSGGGRRLCRGRVSAPRVFRRRGRRIDRRPSVPRPPAYAVAYGHGGVGVRAFVPAESLRRATRAPRADHSRQLVLTAGSKFRSARGWRSGLTVRAVFESDEGRQGGENRTGYSATAPPTASSQPADEKGSPPGLTQRTRHSAPLPAPATRGAPQAYRSSDRGRRTLTSPSRRSLHFGTEGTKRGVSVGPPGGPLSARFSGRRSTRYLFLRALRAYSARRQGASTSNPRSGSRTGRPFREGGGKCVWWKAGPA